MGNNKDFTVKNSIVVGGTVDGRDLATDGTKLDGIEAGADVTDTINVTAAGALMDSEVDADIKTLVLPAFTTISTYGASLVDDLTAAAARTTLGLGTAATTDSTAYATAAQGTTADAALPKAGGTMTGNIIMPALGTVDGRDISVDGTKLDGVASGAEVNQNAFSNIAVSGQTTVAADGKTDTLTLAAGTNITLTTNAATDTVTITAASGAPSTADVLSATAGASYAAVGSYVMARYLPTGSTAGTLPGVTRAGSTLYPANTYSANASGYYNQPLSGTWRVMGQTNYYNGSTQGTTGSTQTSLFLRIS